MGTGVYSGNRPILMADFEILIVTNRPSFGMSVVTMQIYNYAPAKLELPMTPAQTQGDNQQRLNFWDCQRRLINNAHRLKFLPISFLSYYLNKDVNLT